MIYEVFQILYFLGITLSLVEQQGRLRGEAFTFFLHGSSTSAAGHLPFPLALDFLILLSPLLASLANLPSSSTFFSSSTLLSSFNFFFSSDHLFSMSCHTMDNPRFLSFSIPSASAPIPVTFSSIWSSIWKPKIELSK
jgi:hypothetical protein